MGNRNAEAENADELRQRGLFGKTLNPKPCRLIGGACSAFWASEDDWVREIGLCIPKDPCTHMWIMYTSALKCVYRNLFKP